MTGIWLQALLFAAVFGVIHRARLGWRWGGGMAIQFALLGVIAAYGLFGPEAQAETATAVGWLLFFAITLLPRRLAALLRQQWQVLDLRGAEETAARLGLFYWGAMGLYWRDMARAMRLACTPPEDDPDAAVTSAALFDQYIASDMPAPFRDGTRALAWSALSLARDWPGIRDRAAARFDPEDAMAASIAPTVWRAHLEMDDWDGACTILARTDLGSGRHAPAAVAMIGLPFYALAGDLPRTAAALAKSGLPENVALAWLAKAQAAAGQLDRARATLARAREATPEEHTQFSRRLDEVATELPNVPVSPDRTSDLVAIDARFAAAERAGSLLAPGPPSWPLGTLAATLVLLHATLVALLWNPEGPQAVWGELAMRRGVLTAADVNAGEYWRLLTHMGLHADIYHLGANVLAVMWLGPRCEKLFGRFSAVAIMLLGGVAGGLAHVYMSPEGWAIGASGGVMALFGASLTGLARARHELTNATWRRQMALLGALLGFQVALDLATPQVAFWVHLGGAVLGLLLGAVWPRGRRTV